MDAQVNWDAVEWVVLDMDGTILDLAFDNYFWRQLVPERYAQARRLTLDEARTELAPRFSAIQHTLPWYCTDYWTGITGLNMAELKREVRHRIGPLDGAIAFLDAMRASGRRLWLATNAHRDSWSLKLEHTGLRGHFDAVICSHDYGAPKEDARFWHAMQAQHPFARERALFVDDSLPVLRAARAYGIGQVVAIRHPDSTQPRRHIDEFPAVDRLADLRPV